MSPSYRSEVLAALAVHGLRPAPSTPPALVKDQVTALYLYELRTLRAAMVRGDFPKTAYADRVARLRQGYALMSLPSERWVEQGAGRQLS